MGCNCGGGKKTVELYRATFADGSGQTYTNEMEAQRAVARKGGAYKKIS